jgi:ketosteroid isomerase-like protein
LIALYAEDWVEVDHRDVGWDERHGREGGAKMLRSAYETLPDLRMEVDEVLACDDRVIALRCSFCGHGVDGGGEAELAVGRVVLIEYGLWVRSEYYDYDDDAAMLARFEELSGAVTALGDRPPERHFAEYQKRIEAHDVAQCLDFYDEGWICIDHRSLSWEPLQGLAAAEELLQSVFAIMPDARIELEEVLACDERVTVMRQTWRGHAADGGGEMAVPLGFVNVIEQGRMRSTELYHPDDRKAMIARYAELGGGLGLLGDRPPERHFAVFARSYARGDPEGVLEQYAEDWTMTDHRQLGWGELRGRDAVAAAVVAAYEGSLDMRLDVDEVIACDERVIALRAAYRGHTVDGGGAWEIPVGQVSLLGDDGLWLSVDQYDADDRETMLARYAELAEDTPDHSAASARATSQRHGADDDWEASLADDLNLFDLRLNGWGSLHGSDSVAARLGESLRGRPLHRADWAVLLRHPDGWFALALLGRQQIAYVEILSDAPAARERYRALVEDPEGAATVRLGIAWLQALNRRDRAGLKACLHDDMVVIDHRPASTYASETRADAYVELMLATSSVSDDVRWWWSDAVEDHPGLVGRAGVLMSGHLNDGGGSAEIRVDGVHVRRGDRLERVELFAPGTIAEQQNRVAELRARPPLGSQASPADDHRPDAAV